MPRRICVTVMYIYIHGHRQSSFWRQVFQVLLLSFCTGCYCQMMILMDLINRNGGWWYTSNNGYLRIRGDFHQQKVWIELDIFRQWIWVGALKQFVFSSSTEMMIPLTLLFPGFSLATEVVTLLILRSIMGHFLVRWREAIWRGVVSPECRWKPEWHRCGTESVPDGAGWEVGGAGVPPKKWLSNMVGSSVAEKSSQRIL